MIVCLTHLYGEKIWGLEWYLPLERIGFFFFFDRCLEALNNQNHLQFSFRAQDFLNHPDDSKSRSCVEIVSWEVAGGIQDGGTHVYLWLIHVDVWKNITIPYKVFICQVKLILKKIVSHSLYSQGIGSPPRSIYHPYLSRPVLQPCLPNPTTLPKA